MEALIIIPVFAAIFAPIVFIGRWILTPIDRAAKLRIAPVRFSIGDFLCLFLALQLPLTAAYQIIDEEDRGPFWLFTIVSWIVAPTIWYACARALSKAGVMNGRHRFVFLGLIMPAVYYGLIPFTVLTVFGVVGLFLGNELGFQRNAWLVVSWLALASVYFFSGVFSRWMLLHVRPGNEVSISHFQTVAEEEPSLSPTLMDRSNRECDPAVG
jgi:hypothetical protein